MLYTNTHLIYNFHEDISSRYLLENIFQFSSPKESLDYELELMESVPGSENTFFEMIQNGL